MKFDHASEYFDDKYGGFGWSRFDLGFDSYGKRSEESPCYNSIRDDGAYAYEGGKVESYEARGTTPKSSTTMGGRSVSIPKRIRR